jgi:AcrR family transcriptional regulator
MKVVGRGDSEQMTIRSLAAELGVAPMSLYRHVRDKDDLLQEVLERLLAPAWRPHVSPELWQAWVAEAADQLRGLLVAQPVALQVFLRHPVTCPAAVARMEAMLGVLHSAGLDDEGAESAYAAIQTYTIGFAALEASRDRWRSPGKVEDPLSARLAGYTTPRQFALGLQYLLDAAARRARGTGFAPGGDHVQMSDDKAP